MDSQQPLYDAHGRAGNAAAQALEARIDAEIREKDGPLFLADAYRQRRREGYRPDQIDYDMCHVFR